MRKEFYFDSIIRTPKRTISSRFKSDVSSTLISFVEENKKQQSEIETLKNDLKLIKGRNNFKIINTMDNYKTEINLDSHHGSYIKLESNKSSISLGSDDRLSVEVIALRKENEFLKDNIQKTRILSTSSA